MGHNYEQWDGNCTLHFKLTTTFSAKLTPNFGQKRAAPGLIWPKSHVWMVEDWFRSNQRSNFINEKSLQSLGGESYMAFSSKHIIYCQADPQTWPKTDSLGATLAQITCLHDWWLLQKHSKVKTGSQAKIITPGTGIILGVFSQSQHFLSRWPPILAKNEQLHDWFGPNGMYKWLQMATEAVQSQNGFMSKIYKSWDGNYEEAGTLGEG